MSDHQMEDFDFTIILAVQQPAVCILQMQLSSKNKKIKKGCTDILSFPTWLINTEPSLLPLHCLDPRH